MIRNYLISTLRKIHRNFGVQIINILGLAIGLAISFLIYIYLIHETGFDKQHKKRDFIFRLICNYHPEGSESNYTISNIEEDFILKLKEEYPEINKVVSLYKTIEYNQIKYKSIRNSEDCIYFSDPDILDIFTFEILKGEKSNLLVNNFDVLITESKSKIYFNNEDPIGKILTLETKNDTVLLTVKGVIKDFPINSTLKFDFLGKISSTYKNYNSNVFPEETYLMLNQNVNYREFEKKIPEIRYNDGTVMISSFSLQPFNEIYFNSDFIRSYPKKTGNKKNVYILSIIAIVILLVSMNNYIIFSISDTKALVKEIAIRKTLGASIKNLQLQQLINSLIYAIIASVIALIITYFLIPFWNLYFEVDLFPILFNNVNILLGLIFIIFFTAIISGLYNSFYISTLNPLLLLHSSFITIKTKNLFQIIIIGFQILLFVTLISFSIIIKNQIEFAINKDSGFDKENLLIIDFSDDEIKNKFHAFKNEIKTLPFIEEITATSHVIPNNNYYKVHFPKYSDPTQNVILFLLMVDENFFNTMSIPFIEKNNDFNGFSNKKAYIINEMAANELGLDVNTGLPVRFLSNKGDTIIIEKICKNFDIQSVNHQHSPLAIRLHETKLSNILIRLKNEKPDDAIIQIENLFYKTVSQDSQIHINYFKKNLENIYKKDKLFLNAISLGTLITILIAALGLFNVSLFILKSKTKEILIRKVHGATKLSIIKLLCKEQGVIIIMANILAIPITIVLINQWLQNYSQHVKITIDIFIVSSCISVIIMVVISIITLKIIFRRSIISELNKE
ncbi:MAG: ABC transporter permease [Bacteroidales bacterium]|jgi:putative ABC transport system permease protein|nr:ABC transporter permease [Bacteroidales bacterium]